MDEERLMILKMLSEGKLTPEEAAQLLQALDDGGEAAAEEPGVGTPAPGAGTVAPEAGADGPAASPPPPPPPPPPPEAQTGVEGTGTGFGGLGSLLEGLLSRFTPEQAPGIEVAEEVQGELTGREVELDLESTNGRITVRGWGQPIYRAVIVRRVRAAGSAEALRRGQELAPLQVSPGRIALHAPVHFDLTLCTIELWLPADRSYRLHARTGNGRLEVQELSGGPVARLQSGNGRVGLSGGLWDVVDLKTGNGSAGFRGRGRRVDLTTGNGSATVEPQGPEPTALTVTTGNGSVTLDTRGMAGTPLDLEITTGVGSIRHELPGLEVLQERKHLTGHRLQARTGSGEVAGRSRLTVRTGVGSVTLQ